MSESPSSDPPPPPRAGAARTRSGVTRLLRSLRRPRLRGQVVGAVLLAALGFAGVAQVRATHGNEVYAGARQGELVQLLDSLNTAAQRAEAQISKLRQTRNSLQSSNDSRAAAREQARERAQVLGILAGTLPAVGPGVRITVKDPAGTVGVDQLLNAVMELRDAGAEAIELNNKVRVVAQTALADAPHGIKAGGKLLSAPYVIEAIGNPHTLSQAMSFAGGFIDAVERVGGKVNVEERDSVVVATTLEPEAPDYATPSPTE